MGLCLENFRCCGHFAVEKGKSSRRGPAAHGDNFEDRTGWLRRAKPGQVPRGYKVPKLLLEQKRERSEERIADTLSVDHPGANLLLSLQSLVAKSLDYGCVFPRIRNQDTYAGSGLLRIATAHWSSKKVWRPDIDSKPIQTVRNNFQSKEWSSSRALSLVAVGAIILRRSQPSCRFVSASPAFLQELWLRGGLLWSGAKAL